MTRTLLVSALLLTATLAHAQRPFRPTIVEPVGDVVTQLEQAYTPEREKLWCVTAHTVEERDRYRYVRVTAVREERGVNARALGITITGRECRGPVMEPLPMIHSHPPGMAQCQAPVDDINVIIARQAPFDGIQCGPRSIVWYFSPLLLAYATAQDIALGEPPE